MQAILLAHHLKDHCRIGSLERNDKRQHEFENDHCRIGSLENIPAVCAGIVIDHCRIGSLETALVLSKCGWI